jgi:hypothetical protein
MTDTTRQRSEAVSRTMALEFIIARMVEMGAAL